MSYWLFLNSIDFILQKHFSNASALSEICIWELFLNTRLEVIVTSAYGRHKQVQGATFSFYFLAFRTTEMYK